MNSYDRYLEKFWSEHRKINPADVTYTEENTFYPCRDKQRIGKAKVGDGVTINGEAFLMPDGRVFEMTYQEGSGIQKLWAYENINDWKEYAQPMPYTVYARG